MLSGTLDGFFLFLTQLAESPWPYLFIAWIYWCENKKTGSVLALNTGISCAVSQAVKGFCRIERPWVRDERIVPVSEALDAASDYSFPSGNTVRAGTAYGLFGLELFRRKRGQAGIACIVLFFLIAFSRNYLGVHTITDVAAGVGITLIDYLILSRTLIWADKGRNRDIVIIAVICVLAFCPMLWLGCLSNAGACFGFFGGWFVERRFICFDNPDSWEEKAERGIIGFICILFISKAFQSALSVLIAGKYANFFTSFFLSFFIMAVFPAMYSWTGKLRWAVIVMTCLVFCSPFAIFMIKEGVHAASQEEKHVMVIGHRGFAAAAPENTMPSFEKALAQNVDYIELDVQLSADRQIIVCHDPNLLRLTGENVELSSLTLDELRRLDFGSWYSPEYTGTTIPTLAEVLDRIKDTEVRLYLELKDIGADPEFPQAVLQLVQEKGMMQQCVFASFNYDYILQIKKMDQDAEILLNTDSSEVTLPANYPADYYGVYYMSLSPELVNAIHVRGASVFVFSVEGTDQMKAVIQMGADGICSNTPDLAQTVLSNMEYNS